MQIIWFDNISDDKKITWYALEFLSLMVTTYFFIITYSIKMVFPTTLIFRSDEDFIMSSTWSRLSFTLYMQ